MHSDVNRDLLEAIREHDVGIVQSCLQNGADPNYTWTSSIDPSPSQPTTPLSLLVFLISDCLLSDEDLSEFYRIADILLENNADPEPALHLATQRYGIYKKSESPSIFDDIYRLVYEAHNKTQTGD